MYIYLIYFDVDYSKREEKEGDLIKRVDVHNLIWRWLINQIVSNSENFVPGNVN